MELKVTPDSMLEDIVNFRPTINANKTNEHIAKVTAYAMYVLSSKWNVGEKKLEVKHTNLKGSTSAAYNNEGVIKLRNKSFKKHSSYASDLVDVFHEAYHFAQDTGSVEDGISIKSNKSFAWSNGIINLINSYYKDQGILKGLCTPQDLQDSKKHNLYDYIYARYLANDSEREAREFSVSLLDSIVTEAKAKGLFKGITGLYNAKMMEKEIDKEHHDNNARNASANRILSSEDKYFRGVITKIYDSVTASVDGQPSILQNLGSMSSEEWEDYNKKYGDPYFQLFCSLTMHYDEKFANTLVDTLLDLDDERFDSIGALTISRILNNTNFTATDEQSHKIIERVNQLDVEFWLKDNIQDGLNKNFEITE